MSNCTRKIIIPVNCQSSKEKVFGQNGDDAPSRIQSLENILFESSVTSFIIFKMLFNFYMSTDKDVASSIPGAVPHGLQIGVC